MIRIGEIIGPDVATKLKEYDAKQPVQKQVSKPTYMGNKVTITPEVDIATGTNPNLPFPPQEGIHQQPTGKPPIMENNLGDTTNPPVVVFDATAPSQPTTEKTGDGKERKKQDQHVQKRYKKKGSKNPPKVGPAGVIAHRQNH